MPLEAKSAYCGRRRSASLAAMALAIGFATSWRLSGFSQSTRTTVALSATVCALLLDAILIRVRIRRA